MHLLSLTTHVLTLHASHYQAGHWIITQLSTLFQLTTRCMIFIAALAIPDDLKFTTGGPIKLLRLSQAKAKTTFWNF